MPAGIIAWSIAWTIMIYVAYIMPPAYGWGTECEVQLYLGIALIAIIAEGQVS